MRAPARMGHVVASLLAAFFLVAGLCGAMCEVAVAVCVENCDPCLSQCKCHHTCEHSLLDSRTSHRLGSYRLLIVDQPDGGVVRQIVEISGLSLDLADGPRAHAAPDFERFAEGVIETNGLLLQARVRKWEPGMTQVIGESVVVPFQSGSSEASLTFLFDRRGNLIEVDEVRPGSGFTGLPR
jgi:hypothetical protein